MFVAWACISPWGAFPGRLRAVLASVAPLHNLLGVRLHMSSWLLLGSLFSVVAFVCFLVLPLPPLPIQGSRGLSSIVFSI